MQPKRRLESSTTGRCTRRARLPSETSTSRTDAITTRRIDTEIVDIRIIDGTFTGLPTLYFYLPGELFHLPRSSCTIVVRRLFAHREFRLSDIEFTRRSRERERDGVGFRVNATARKQRVCSSAPPLLSSRGLYDLISVFSVGNLAECTLAELYDSCKVQPIVRAAGKRTAISARETGADAQAQQN